jgi:hypothetical protein
MLPDEKIHELAEVAFYGLLHNGGGSIVAAIENGIRAALVANDRAFTLMPLYEKLADEIRRIEAWTNPGVSDILFAITKAKGETKCGAEMKDRHEIDCVDYLQRQLNAAREVHRLDIQTQTEMVTKLEQTQAACTALREALAEYATCQNDGCTCGDGWSHHTARDALDQTNPGQPLLDQLAAVKKENDRLLNLCVAAGFVGQGTQIVGNVYLTKLKAELADIRTRLGGAPDAQLDGDDGLAAAVRASADQPEAALGEPRKPGQTVAEVIDVLRRRRSDRAALPDLRAFCIATVVAIDEAEKFVSEF